MYGSCKAWLRHTFSCNRYQAADWRLRPLPDEMIKYCALMLFDPLIIMFYLNISEEVALDRSAWRLAINVPEP